MITINDILSDAHKLGIDIILLSNNGCTIYSDQSLTLIRPSLKELNDAIYKSHKLGYSCIYVQYEFRGEA